MSVEGQGATGAQPLLVCRELTRSYEEFLALDSLSLRIGAGELVALVGPNGAGKTTFLTLAAGLLEPTSGAVEAAGEAAGTISARREVSYLPDAPVFYEDLSLDEHLSYVAGLHGVADAGAHSSQLLERLGLDEWGENLPSEFSRGMRQKASIAIALVRPFSVLLADEPFDGLDPPSRAVLFELLAEACENGSAVVVASHRPDVIAAASRCVALLDGRLAYDGAANAEALGDLFDLSQ